MTDAGLALPALIEPRGDTDPVRERLAHAAGRASAAVIREAHVHDVPTRVVDDPVRAPGPSGLAGSGVSRPGRGEGSTNGWAPAPPARPIEGDGPCRWIDATCVRARDGGRIASTAAMTVTAVDTDGRREVPGMARPARPPGPSAVPDRPPALAGRPGPSAVPARFPALAGRPRPARGEARHRRRPRGPARAAATRVPHAATLQRCRVHTRSGRDRPSGASGPWRPDGGPRSGMTGWIPELSPRRRRSAR